MGDIPLRAAYKLIKAISKKKTDIISAERERFTKGCLEKGLTEKEATDIWDIIERFAGYGFNKSHSTRYAFVAYQTAYFKAHYPVEFMAALLTYDGDVTDKVVDYISECQAELGIEILPPDINESGSQFTPVYRDKAAVEGEDQPEGEPEKEGVIRFGLSAVKGVGDKAVEQIIAARKEVGHFKSLYHFCENVDLRAVNKQVMEALIKAGAFDRLGGNRNQMMVGLEGAMQSGSTLQADKQKGQMNFFGQMAGGDDYADDAERLPDVPPWPEQQMLAFEKQVLGFYVTSNPLSQHAEMVNIYSTTNTAKLAGRLQDAEVILGGMIAKVRYNVIKNGRQAGKKMAVMTVEDLQGAVDVIVFPGELEKFSEVIELDKVVFVKGKVDQKRERPQIITDELIGLDEVTEKLAARVAIKLDSKAVTQERVQEIRSLCEHHRGRSTLLVAIHTDKGRVYANADQKLRINPSIDFCKKMKQLVGEENLVLTK